MSTTPKTPRSSEAKRNESPKRSKSPTRGDRRSESPSKRSKSPKRPDSSPRRSESPTKKQRNLEPPPNGTGNHHDSEDSSSTSTSEDEPKKPRAEKTTPPPPTRRSSSPMINSAAKGVVSAVSGGSPTASASATPPLAEEEKKRGKIARAGSLTVSITGPSNKVSSPSAEKKQKKKPKFKTTNASDKPSPPVPLKRQGSSAHIAPPPPISIPQAREKLNDTMGIRPRRTPSFHFRGSRLITAAATNINAAIAVAGEPNDSLASPKSSDSIASLARRSSSAASSSLNLSSANLNLAITSPFISPRPALRRTVSEPFMNTWEFNGLEVDLWVPTIGFILERWRRLREKKQPPPQLARVKHRERRGSSEGFSMSDLEEKIKLKFAEPSPKELIWEDDSDNEGNKVIVAGTLPLLLQALADHNTSDKEYIDIFLSTHTHFIGTRELFNALKKQFDEPVGQQSSLTPLEHIQYSNVLRLRIINVFKKWLRYHDYDFQTADAKKSMEAFIDQLDSQADCKQWATFLKQAWNRLQVVGEDDNDVFPKTILPSKKKVEELNCLEMVPVEMARQLTLIHYKLFSKISNPILISAAKSAKAKDPNNPVTIISEFSDRINRWAATEIVAKADMKKRVSVMSQLIKLANQLVKINNYHGAMDIFLALSHYSVAKLKKTWKSLGKNSSQLWKNLVDLFNPIGGWRNLRKRILVAPTPVIIPPAIWLHDLLAIEENDDMWDEDKTLINFEKMRLFSGVFKNVYRCQVEPYHFAPVDIIQEYFEKKMHFLTMEDIETMVDQLLATESSGEGTPSKLKRRPSVTQLLRNKLLPKKDKEK